MPKGVARGDVHRQQEGLDAHHKRADREPVTVVGRGVKVHGVGDVPPFDQNDDHSGIEEVPVKVVEEKHSPLSTVADGLVDVGFVHPTSGWARKERPVVHPSHVVAGPTKSERYPQDENGGVDPLRVVPRRKTKQVPFQDVWGKDGGHHRAAVKGVRNLGVIEKQAPKRVDESGVQTNAHGDRLTPPVVDAIGSSQSIENREFNPLAYPFPPCSMRNITAMACGVFMLHLVCVCWF